MIIIAESDQPPAVAELDDLARAALTRITGDSDEQRATTRRKRMPR